MLIQTDFESLVPTDQGWSFEFCKAFSREATTYGVSGGIFGVRVEVGFFIFKCIIDVTDFKYIYTCIYIIYCLSAYSL